MTTLLLVSATAHAGGPAESESADRVLAECGPRGAWQGNPQGWGPLWFDPQHPGLVHRRGPVPAPPHMDTSLADPNGGGTRLLRDSTGAVFAELGFAEIGGQLRRVHFTRAFTDPVVLLGPPTQRDPEPGVARIFYRDATGFCAKFQRWMADDDTHAPETVPYAVVERGVHVLAGGSVWEAGTSFADGSGRWTDTAFAAHFGHDPLLLLTLQTRLERDPVTARARDVSAAHGFRAALFEAGASVDGHEPEQLGYLAVDAPAGSGSLDAEGGPLPYLVRKVLSDHRPSPILSATLRLEEERSADADVAHGDETLAVVALGPYLFAQDVTANDLDTAALRRTGPDHGGQLEWGTVPELTDVWQTVPFGLEYTNPVVVVKPISSLGGDPAIIGVRNVTSYGFDVKVREWGYLDGVHQSKERVFYLVAEAGVQEVGGLLVEASQRETTTLVGPRWDQVTFAAPFDATPGVFAALMTVRGSDPAVVRMRNRNARGVQVAMQEEEARGGTHVAETLGWIAIEAGAGETADGRALRVLHKKASDAWTGVGFGESLGGRFPFLVGSIASTVAVDPVELNFQRLTPEGVDLRVREEDSRDAEHVHVAEDIALFVGE